MILHNPDTGASIKTRVEMKIWEIPVGKVLEFDDLVGQELKNRYEFLEVIETNEPAQVLEVADGFKCSRCEYASKTKIGVLGHLRGHKAEKIEFEKAIPVGDAKPGKTLYEVRAERMSQAMSQASEDEVNLYGPGMTEER